MAKAHNKLFVVRKYIWAKNAGQAIKKDRETPVEDVWIDEDWKKSSNNPKDAIGFYAPKDNEN